LGGGINVSTAYLRQNRNLVLNFLKGYIDGIHYMLRRKDESLMVLYKYFQNSDSVAMSYLYDETSQRLEKDLRANPESIHFHLDMAALDDPRAKQLSDKAFFGIRVWSTRFAVPDLSNSSIKINDAK